MQPYKFTRIWNIGKVVAHRLWLWTCALKLLGNNLHLVNLATLNYLFNAVLRPTQCRSMKHKFKTVKSSSSTLPLLVLKKINWKKHAAALTLAVGVVILITSDCPHFFIHKRYCVHFISSTPTLLCHKGQSSVITHFYRTVCSAGEATSNAFHRFTRCMYKLYQETIFFLVH